jgi:hypothetical protein
MYEEVGPGGLDGTCSPWLGRDRKLDPDESTRKLIEEMLKRDPIPLEELENHKH